MLEHYFGQDGPLQPGDVAVCGFVAKRTPLPLRGLERKATGECPKCLRIYRVELADRFADHNYMEG